MSYKSWFQKHAKKHENLVAKLNSNAITDEALVDYFEFENMVEKETSFCPLYAKKQKCHDVEYLNCFLCACPHFRFSDEGLHVKSNGIVVKSECSIHSRFASEFIHENISHLDCSKCSIPHTKAFVKKYMKMSWSQAMKNCLQY